MSNLDVQNALEEYGSAIRGDWSTIDGRSVRSDLENLASWIDKPDAPDLSTMRDLLDVCPEGCGHWTEYCDNNCEDSE